MNEEAYLQDRLEDQIAWYDAKSQHNQRWFKRFGLIQIIAAALIPLCSGLLVEWPYYPWVVGLLGVLVAVLASLVTLNKYQENWIQYRTTAEQLKHEKFMYLTHTAPYHENDAFNKLVMRVEDLISKENSRWSLKFATKNNKTTRKKSG